MTTAKTIFDGGSPKTQSIEAVKALLSWRGLASNSLPPFIEVGKGEGRVVLVLSNKRDAYYCTTATKCSCPSAVYSPAMVCKHRRKYFAAPKKSPEELEAESDAILASQLGAKRLARPPQDSIRPDMAGFRPVAKLPGEA